MRKSKTETSSYRGVSKQGLKWRASITTADKKTKYLGLFWTQTEAAREYDKHAVLFFGTKAKLNFPEEFVLPIKYVSKTLTR